MVLQLEAEVTLLGPVLKVLMKDVIPLGIQPIGLPGHHGCGACTAGGERDGSNLWPGLHQMTQFQSLGREVGGVVGPRIDHQRHPIIYVKAIAIEAGNLAGVVGDQAKMAHA
jgi:hypothetical protein